MNFESRRQVKSLKVPRKESYSRKKEDLDSVRGILEEKFGKDKLPKDLVLDMVGIRKDIKAEIDREEFVDELDNLVDKRIKQLFAKIYNPSLKDENIQEITEEENGNIKIIFQDGKEESLGENEKELLFSLRSYFESYRLALNANKFRENVSDIRGTIITEHGERKVNFYSESEKEKEVIARLKEKYEQAGFSEAELKELLEVCDLKDLESIPVHKIHMMRKISDIFSRFMQGDKTKFVALSAALMVPAFLQGYAPMLFADAFKENSVDLEHIILYALTSIGSTGTYLLIQKNFRDFINKNYQKKGGISEFTAHNLTEMPPNETRKFGLETVKHRVSQGRNSYEGVLNSFSYDLLPDITTLVTGIVMLYQKSPILAGSTAVASGITIVLDKYFQKVGGFLEKERSAERTSEEMAKKLNEQLSAHMEVILAGEKERFFNEVKHFIEQEKLAETSKEFFEVFQISFAEVTSAINLTLAGLASFLAGGSPDKTLAAIIYSGNFSHGLQSLLNTKRHVLRHLRNIMQMELMFNGYAEGEEKEEGKRIGVDQIQGGDINLKNVNVELEDKKILDNINLNIPAGSMVYLEGASGGGKSTLMKIISGYYHPSSGEVKFGGVNVRDIKKTGEHSIYRRIAYLSQFPYLFDDSLKSNLKFGLGKDISDDKLKEVIKEVGLDHRFRDLNERLFSGHGDSGKTSGGETSRIGLARVLLKIRNSDCRIVFLDEPTASVDEATKKDIADLIKKEKKKRPDTTFIVISHDRQFVEMLNCDTQIKMDKGKIIEK